MIKVNLLATAPGASAPREWLPREQRSALGGLGMLMLTALVAGGWWYYLSHQQTTLDARIAGAETELVRLKEAAKLVERTNARKQELSERLALIDRLRSAKRAPVTLLETVSRSLPEGLWLTEMKQAGKMVQIEGRASSLTAVTDFAEQLQNSGLFKRPVEILTTTTEVIEELTLVRFVVKAEAAEQPTTPVTPATTSTAAATPAPASPGA